VQIVVTVRSDGTKREHKSFVSRRAKQLLKLSVIKQAYGENVVSRTRVLELYASFGAALKIPKMTNAVEDRQPFDHLT
jgi:hypothetical protein